MKFKRLLLCFGILLVCFACGDLAGDYAGSLRKMPEEKVMSMLRDHQYPATLEEVDSLHMKAVWQIFQHAAGQKYRKKYFKQLKTAAHRGDLDPAEVAQMEDRILVADGQPQRYGTYLKYDWPSKTYELYEMEAPELVDSRRSEVGLGPICEFLKEYRVDFSIAQIH